MPSGWTIDDRRSQGVFLILLGKMENGTVLGFSVHVVLWLGSHLTKQEHSVWWHGGLKGSISPVP